MTTKSWERQIWTKCQWRRLRWAANENDERAKLQSISHTRGKYTNSTSPNENNSESINKGAGDMYLTTKSINNKNIWKLHKLRWKTVYCEKCITKRILVHRGPAGTSLGSSFRLLRSRIVKWPCTLYYSVYSYHPSGVSKSKWDVSSQLPMCLATFAMMDWKYDSYPGHMAQFTSLGALSNKSNVPWYPTANLQ